MEAIKSPLTFYILWISQHLIHRAHCRIDYMARVENCQLGHDTRIYREATVKDSTVGDHSYIGRGSHIQQAEIGKYCSIGAFVKIGGGVHDTAGASTHPLLAECHTKKVEIGHDVWIGQAAIILDGVKIGNGAIIGAGCVVTRNVGKFSIVGGNPMRVLRKRPVQDESWY